MATIALYKEEEEKLFVMINATLTSV